MSCQADITLLNINVPLTRFKTYKAKPENQEECIRLAQVHHQLDLTDI
jgi:hypothetical protein